MPLIKYKLNSMDSKEAGKYWNENAEAWTKLSRAGYDMYRNHLNTPAFFAILPDVNGLKGIDIGCGEGYNTRLMVKYGAQMTAIDISEVFIKHAIEEEKENPLNIKYSIADASGLPFENESFDLATAFMSLMDIPEPEKALKEIYRVLKPGGFLQFSICHPCFLTPHRKNLRNSDGKTYAIEIGDYFTNLNWYIEEWTFGAAPAEMRKDFPKFRIPVFVRTLSQWINILISIGFTIEYMNEPVPSEKTIGKYPYLQDASVVAYFLQVRVRKL